MLIDATDADFETEVLQRSATTPVVVDLWAPWCGPCKTLGPILEKVIGATDGAVVLAKVNVDENPAVSAQFQVQGIPAVHAVVNGAVVDHFVGARGEAEVTTFVQGLLPSADDQLLDQLVAAGDEASLNQALEVRSDHPPAVLALAEVFAASDRGDEALDLLRRIPDTNESRRVAALARNGGEVTDTDDIARSIDELLPTVKSDDAARQRVVDLLELLGPDDPRTGDLRRRLTSALY